MHGHNIAGKQKQQIGNGQYTIQSLHSLMHILVFVFDYERDGKHGHALVPLSLHGDHGALHGAATGQHLKYEHGISERAH